MDRLINGSVLMLHLEQTTFQWTVSLIFKGSAMAGDPHAHDSQKRCKLAAISAFLISMLVIVELPYFSYCFGGRCKDCIEKDGAFEPQGL